MALELLTLQGGLTGVIGGLVDLLGLLGLNLLGSIRALVKNTEGEPPARYLPLRYPEDNIQGLLKGGGQDFFMQA